MRARAPWLALAAGLACTRAETLGVYEQTTAGPSSGVTESEGDAGGASSSASTKGTSTADAGATTQGASDGGDATTGGATTSDVTTGGVGTSVSETGSTSTGTGSGNESDSEGTGGGVCDPAPDDTSCQTCVKEECCQALLLCEEEPGCVCMESCVADGMSFPACQEQCSPGAAYAFLSGCRAALCMCV